MLLAFIGRYQNDLNKFIQKNDKDRKYQMWLSDAQQWDALLKEEIQRGESREAAILATQI